MESARMEKEWSESMQAAGRILRLIGCGFAAGAIGLPMPAHAQAASFDCTRAATPTERAICGTSTLGVKDVRMATYYQILQEAHPAVSGMAYREFRDAIHDEQTQWIKNRRDVCKGNVACLEQAYDRRIGALHDTLMKNLAITYGRMCDGG